MRPPVSGVDGLHDAIRVAGARGSVGSRLRAGGAWGLWLPDAPYAALHLILSGTVWLEVEANHPRRLNAGDVIWLPPHTAHGLAGRPGLPMGPCDRAAAERARQTGTEMCLGQYPAQVRLLTLHYTQDPAVDTPVLLALGSLIRLSVGDHPNLRAARQLLEQELEHPGLGTTAALNSLIDLLLIQLIRARFADAPENQNGLALCASIDSITRDAVNLIHRDPARAWTTATLARAVGTSRATLTRRFERSLEQSPGSYLAGCRMDLVALRLRDTDDTIDMISRSVGYTSANALSRAFRRYKGLNPRAYRKLSRDSADAHRPASESEQVTIGLAEVI